jgi:hypothetical protein
MFGTRESESTPGIWNIFLSRSLRPKWRGWESACRSAERSSPSGAADSGPRRTRKTGRHYRSPFRGCRPSRRSDDPWFHPTPCSARARRACRIGIGGPRLRKVGSHTLCPVGTIQIIGLRHQTDGLPEALGGVTVHSHRICLDGRVYRCGQSAPRTGPSVPRGTSFFPPLVCPLGSPSVCTSLGCAFAHRRP